MTSEQYRQDCCGRCSLRTKYGPYLLLGMRCELLDAAGAAFDAGRVSGGGHVRAGDGKEAD